MLLLPEEFTDTTGLMCLLRGWAAYDPETGARLHHSRRTYRAGHKRHYAVVRADGTSFRLRAVTDREAVARANARLRRAAPPARAHTPPPATRALARSPICTCARVQTALPGLTQFLWDEECPEHWLGRVIR